MEIKNIDLIHETVPKIEFWGKDKGILEKSTPYKQALKTKEEILELYEAIEDDNRAEIADALGDIVVTIILFCKLKGFSFVEVLNYISNLETLSEQEMEEEYWLKYSEDETEKSHQRKLRYYRFHITTKGIREDLYFSLFLLDTVHCNMLFAMNTDELKIGDYFYKVVGMTLKLIFISEMKSLDIGNCLKDVYGVISKRKGKMKNGKFVKD